MCCVLFLKFCCVQMEEQSRNDVWFHDLLALKMFRQPLAGGMNHFYLVLVHVGTKRVVCIYDGLVDDGVCRWMCAVLCAAL
jgi:hypothetical protein